MTAAWRLIPTNPWSEQRRNPALVLAVLVHLAVLGALGVGQLLRVVPPPEEPFGPPTIVSIFLPPPPVEPEPVPVAPDYPVHIPRGPAPAPQLPRAAAAPERVGDLPDTGPGPGPDDLGDRPVGEMALFGERGQPGPGGPGDGRDGTGPGHLDGEDDSGGPLTVGPGVLAPTLIHKVAPEYPNIARVSRLEGRVVVEAVIARDGTVEDAEIVHASSRLFEQAALEAVLQWRYAPARLNGRPVRVTFRVNVEFILERP
jgi:protein TonB